MTEPKGVSIGDKLKQDTDCQWPSAPCTCKSWLEAAKDLLVWSGKSKGPSMQDCSEGSTGLCRPSIGEPE